MDDVQYLLKHAKEESYLFLVDSRMRDTAVHATPSEYEISFSSPFRNVFGLDLMDATVARTEYIVDTTTNTLEYAMGQPASLADWNQGAWTAGRKRTITLEPGDYNLPQFVEQLNAKLAAMAELHSEPAIKAAPVTNPSEISNKVVLTCSQAFVLLMAGSSLRWTMGFGDPVTTAASADYAAVPGWSVNLTGGASDAFLSMPAGGIPDEEPSTATLGPIPAGPGVQAEPVYGAHVLRQYFASDTTGPVSSVAAFVTAVGEAPPDLTVRVRRVSDNELLATGTLEATPQDPNDAYAPVAVAMTPVDPLVLLQDGVEYFVEFVAVGGGGSAEENVAVYYNQDNLPQAPTRYISLDGAAVHTGQNLCVDVSAASWGHAVRSPGVVNLTGPRYVNIRCPEIESHMFRDRANERCHAGLGMVQLRGYGFRDQRFDFVSFPPRRFHPLGKLSKLTFRLERPDGTLYDSHGVDHTLLLVLRYYTLPQDAGADDGATGQNRFPLNPKYTPNLRDYLIQSKWAQEAGARDFTSKRY